MKLVIQRAKNASVTVDEAIVGKIEHGFVVLIGISNSDTRDIADKMINKMINLRIFKDSTGKTNLSINDPSVMGELLLISQFTLYADCAHGNRPSFISAGKPDMANDLYEYIIDKCQQILGKERISHGIFGADMKVNLLNDGPFTIILDSNELIK